MIERLSNAYSPSGKEEEVRTIIINELRDFFSEITIDNLGNVIVHKPGKKKTIAITVPMDETGFVVTHSGNDFVVTSSIGNVNEKTLHNILLKDSNLNSYISDKEQQISFNNNKIRNFKLDFCKVNNLYKELVSETLVFEENIKKSDGYYIGKGLERSALCSLLCELARNLTDSLFEYYFIFNSYHNCDFKGAQTASYNLNIDELYYLTGLETEKNIHINKGPVLVIRDKNMISSQLLVEKFEDYKEVQYLVKPDVTYGGGFYQSNPTVKNVVTIGIPIENLHCPNEKVSITDIKCTFDILQKIVLP